MESQSNYKINVWSNDCLLFLFLAFLFVFGCFSCLDDGSWLFLHDVHEVEVIFVVLLSFFHIYLFDVLTDTRLLKRYFFHGPVVSAITHQILLSLILSTMRNAEVYSWRAEYSVDFIKHCFDIAFCTITCAQCIHESLIDDYIKWAIVEFQLPHVHLLEDKIWITIISVVILLQLDGRVTKIDTCDVWVALIKDLFCHSRTAAPSNQDVLSVLHLGHHLCFHCKMGWSSRWRESLQPVELLLLFLITVFPVFYLSVVHIYK